MYASEQITKINEHKARVPVWAPALFTYTSSLLPFCDLYATVFLEFVFHCWLTPDFCGFHAGSFMVWLPVHTLASFLPWDRDYLTTEKYLGNKHEMCFQKRS